ncbi:conserved hypothetical protein [Xenorhabdus bovienii str. Jollieti]|uniref:Uncharacterized protein n=2 Tax=Xenorhabdus bovienii (strain SS-2004) TaxID=406818 RepID=D3UXR2_XENBS|nr:hypothetical protein [Xenorhabdus bovienii]CBJ80437.1 conserved hypothetical protein [Xenorhabdus bovienii SS-2004]CDH30136.1 conserved hypothetical protein [Xenorhabdus bovienii str. Jollieti]
MTDVDKRKIKIILNGEMEEAELHMITSPNRHCCLKIFHNNNQLAESNDTDYFSCFADLRNQLKNIIFLCKGAKINVYPSAMSRDMSDGIVAYETTLGQPGLPENQVHIFDFEDKYVDITPEEQRKFHSQWFESL